MSADNGIIIDLKTLEVKYYQGDQPSGVSDEGKCKTLEEAVKKAQELDNEVGGTEYGIKFINSLKK